jgi:hypothetical protein
MTVLKRVLNDYTPTVLYKSFNNLFLLSEPFNCANLEHCRI